MSAATVSDRQGRSQGRRPEPVPELLRIPLHQSAADKGRTATNNSVKANRFSVH